MLKLFGSTVVKDERGMALIAVMGLMAILFLLGSAALTNTSTESKISQNYLQSVQALYDCEAGVSEAMARIKNNQIPLNQWIQTSSTHFQYKYYVNYDDDEDIYEITAEGHDASNLANRKIIAEVSLPFSPGDINSPVYCGSGENRGQPNTINGNSACEAWADDGDPNNDVSVACVSTPSPKISDTDPLDFHQDQLITSDPNKMEYDIPPINLQAMANYYRDLPPDRTSIPTGGTVTIGSRTDLEVVYINGSETVAGNKTGYGILVVTGDLHLSGQLNWYGVVIVLGNLRQTGGGSHGVQVTGAVLTPNDFDMRGNPDIQWCGDLVRKAMAEAGKPSLQILSWREE